jgi:hypothetical protein
MTEPGDGLEDALRHALSAADEVAPGTDGLSKIRARIDNRPPRPWLLSVLAGRSERMRNWTWRGHWAWPSSLRWPAVFSEPRGRLVPRPGLAGAGGAGLRLGAVLAGIAAIAVISLGVQPFRHAIIAASSTVFDGGSGSRDGGGATAGSSPQTLGSSVANFATTQEAGRAAADVVPGAARSAAAKSTQAEPCVRATATPTAARKTRDGDSPPALAKAPTTEPSATEPSTQSPESSGATDSASPGGSASPTDSASPSDSQTVKRTCPMATATVSPTPSPIPTAASASLSPRVSDTTPATTASTATSSPTPSYAWQTPTQSPFWSQPTHAPRQRRPRAAGRYGR